MQRREREPGRLTGRGPCPAGEHVVLEPGRRAAHADPRPAPYRVDVVRQRDDEACAVPARGFEAEPPTQPLERRVERVETRPRRPKSSVLVALPSTLFDACEMEERLRQVVVGGAFPTLD